MHVYQQENSSSETEFGLLHKLSKISSYFEKMNVLTPQEKAMQVTDDPFLLSLVEKLGTCFAQPEEVIMKQGEKGNDMYFISQGDCIVNVRDDQMREKVAHKLLVEGDYFGDIGILYNFARTSSVICRNYNTMARLSHTNFKSMVSDFPLLKKHMFKQIYQYQDSNINFAKDVMNKIEFLQDISIKSFHHVLFSMEKIQYGKNDYISKAYDYADSMIIICDGVCEVRTRCEGNEFIIEHLGKGSIINHNAFFLEDLIYADI
jgi:F-box/leucine-rich repeat protein 7